MPFGDTGFMAELGGGVLLGFHDRNNEIGVSNTRRPVYLNPGLVLSAGVNYPFAKIPIVVGVGYMPGFTFSPERVSTGENLHLVLRYRCR